MIGWILPSGAHRGVPGFLWTLAATLAIVDVTAVNRGPEFGQDFRVAWLAGRHLLDGRPVYGAARLPFVYPPSSAVLSVPAALLPFGAAQDAAILVTLVCLGLAAVRSAAFAGLKSACVAPIAAIVVGAYEPALAALANLNVSALIAPVVPVYLSWTARGRDRDAGLLLGLSLAIKPLLLPLLIVPILVRRPRALLWPILLPVGLTLVSLPVLPDRSRFFTVVVPALLGHGTSPLGTHNISIRGLFITFAWRTDVADGVRVLVVALAIACAALLWKCPGTLELRLAEVTGALFVGFLLASATNENHYLLMLLPLVATFAHPESHIRTAIVAVGVVLVATARPFPFIGPDGFAVSDVVGLLLLLTGAFLGAGAQVVAARTRRSPAAGAGSAWS
jgi:arabinofuranan 3-O-arabinosyltransferase